MTEAAHFFKVLLFGAAFALIALVRAEAACTENKSGFDVLAVAGDACSASSGAYNPTTTSAVLPTPYSGFGFFAAAWATIDSTGAATIDTTGLNGAHGVWSDGAGAKISLSGATTISTIGANSFGLYASGGGAIVSSAPLTIGATGAGSAGIYATGDYSKITTSDAAIVATADHAAAVAADAGGKVALNGGSVKTTGASSFALAATGGGSIEINGVSVSAAGDGSGGLGASGSGSTISASRIAIAATGNVDAADGYHPIGIDNAALGRTGDGGVVSVSDSTIVVTGREGNGVNTADRGWTTLACDSITIAGAGSNGVVAQDGGIASLYAGSIAATGVGANAVVASGGGGVKLWGTQIAVAADGSQGVFVTGAGSTIDATGVSIATQGGVDPGSGRLSIGLYNGPNGGSTGGGVATLTNSSFATNGAQSYGVATGVGGNTSLVDSEVATRGVAADGVVAAGGQIALSGTKVATSGNDAFGVLASGTGAQVNLSGVNSANTRGAGAVGLLANAGGAINAIGQTAISTGGARSLATGLSAFGVNADGAGSRINLASATIASSGDSAVGLLASDIQGSGRGGVITVAGALDVTTKGKSAYGAWAQGAGSQINLQGSSTFAMDGGAYALYATAGGVINVAGNLTIAAPASGGGGILASDAGSTINLAGPLAIGVSTPNAAGLFVSAGGAIKASGATSVSASAPGDVAVDIVGASYSASGNLKIATSDPTAVGVRLEGDAASIVATGGGSIDTSGAALQFFNGKNQFASFDDFSIANSSGDLIFVDPSTVTINLKNSTLNAGSGNLLNVTLGSSATINADNSTLTGAIQTDSTSTSSLALANGSLWTMTGSSTLTNLSVANSGIVFSPPVGGAFKTLTTTNYSGSGATLTMNAVLGPTGSASDKLVINGGSATGSTKIAINNIGGVGALTTGNGIPLIIAVNGGSTAPNAFQLAQRYVVGGYEYQLLRSGVGGNDPDWYLRSQAVATNANMATSIDTLAITRQSAMITNGLLASILLGANEQINCSNCASGFAAVGSFDVGAHGRWSITDRMTLLAGVALDQFAMSGVTVENSPTVAASLRYDLVDWGKTRPFFEAGGAISPYQATRYSRDYANGSVAATGVGSTIDRSALVFARVGFVSRLAPTDEFAAFVDIARNWQQSNAYTEAASANNPFPATYGNGIDSLNVGRVGAQYTRLFATNLEINVNAAIAHSFAGAVGIGLQIDAFGPILASVPKPATWAELGGRLGYRISDRTVVDAFLLGTVGEEPAGRTLHGGLGIRYAF